MRYHPMLETREDVIKLFLELNLRVRAGDVDFSLFLFYSLII